MIRDLGIVEPGKTLYIPFHTFDSNDPSASVTTTGLATTDIEIYKDGSMTQRASDAGFALLDTDGIDLDGITGIHGISIDLADNTTAGFYAAGSQYWVVISSITVDAATVNFILCTFRIGYQAARLNTTIATLASQTSFTLTAGPAEDDALNGFYCIIHDVASAVQQGHALILDYTGSTKTVTLAAGTTFTAAASDNIAIMGPAPLQPATTGRTLVVDSAGLADANTVKIGPTGSGTAQTARDVGASVLLSSGTGTGQVTLTSGRVNADLTHIAAAAVSTSTAQLGVNVVNFGGAAGTFASGRPEVNTSHIAGSAVSTSSAQIGVNVVNAGGTAWASGSLTSGVFATGAITATSIAADAIGASELAADAVAEIADAVWDEVTSGHTTAGTFGQGNYIVRANTAQAGASTTITLDASASATDDIYNNDLIVITAGTGAGQSRFISDYVGSTKVATVPTWQTNPGADSVFVILPFGAIAGATAPTAAEVADAVWDEARAGHVAAGSFGEYTPANATHIAGSAVSTSTAQLGVNVVNAAGTAWASGAITSGAFATGAITSGAIAADAIGASELAADAVAEIADAVWDELQSGHVGAGTFGEVATEVAAILVDTAEIGTAGAGLTNINLPDQTMNITGDITGSLSGSVGSVTGAVGSVTGAVGSVTGAVGSVTGNVGGNVTGSVGSLATQAKADVNAEVLDVLNTDTFAEPGQEAPGATVSLVKKIGYLYKAWRNKSTQTATTYSLYADDTTTVDQKATVSDDATTLTKGEVATGP